MVLRTDIKTEDLIFLYNKGYSASELSVNFNTTPSMIINRLKKSRIDTRNRQDYLTKRISDKISNNQKGNNNSNWKNAYKEFICEYCGKTFKTYDLGRDKVKFCGNKCAHKGMGNSMQGKTGIKSPLWKEKKKRPFRKALRGLYKADEWRKQVFKRDNYTCQICRKHGGYLEAHHIIPFAKLLDKFHIETYDDAFHCKKLWDAKNGVTYCKECHSKVDKRRNIGGKKNEKK